MNAEQKPKLREGSKAKGGEGKTACRQPESAQQRKERILKAKNKTPCMLSETQTVQ